MSDDFAIPKHLQTTKYIESKTKVICKLINEKLSLDFYNKTDLENTIFSAEQIALVCRAELSDRKETERHQEVVDVSELKDLELIYENGIYSLTVPITVKMTTKHSWYLATLTRRAVRKYISQYGHIHFSQPMITVCERIIPSANAPVKDNDNFEVHRIINEVLLQAGQGDHPLRMSFYSTVRVEEGKRYTKLYFMNQANFIDWWSSKNSSKSS